MTETKPTIYLVDDDESLRRALVRLIRSAAMEVLAFESAETLFAAGPLLQPACLVVDVHLPGASGLEIHHRLPAVPVVFITAVDDEYTRQLAAQGKLLFKPFDAQQLLEAIDRALAGITP